MVSDLDLSRMNGEELATALRQARAQLQDLDEERRATLGQTGVHLDAGEVAALRAAWDRDEQELRAGSASFGNAWPRSIPAWANRAPQAQPGQ